MYYYYDYCSKCGGEYESRGGQVFDTYPSSEPVRCKECKHESYSEPYDQCIAVGWKER